MAELDTLRRAPWVHVLLLFLGLWAMVVGGTVTVGSWGDFDVRLAMVYLIPAIALHAWGSYLGRGGVVAKAAAWLLVGWMCVASGVLLRAVVLLAVGLVAALDLALALKSAPRAERQRAPLKLRAAAAGIAVAALAGVALLAQFANFEPAVRLSVAVIVLAALAIAATLRSALRAPQKLLPALGVYYVFFAFVAAPVLPFGPLVAWWALILLLLAGALVAARHVLGAEAPWHLAPHEQGVVALPDPAVAATANDVDLYLQHGDHADALAERVAHATGKPASTLTKLARKGTPAQREAALRDLLELTD
ncbi:MAG TPA: hypothetical protein VGR28_14140 [Candidatus Thermoplasmatota archaeon]|nr:hypothetical protein [Candidatus Thermoplasmatota archaeon]